MNMNKIMDMIIKMYIVFNYVHLHVHTWTKNEHEYEHVHVHAHLRIHAVHEYECVHSM
jgi:hypothetical protein